MDCPVPLHTVIQQIGGALLLIERKKGEDLGVWGQRGVLEECNGVVYSDLKAKPTIQ